MRGFWYADDAQTNSWCSTAVSFAPVSSPEYELAPGHWRQDVTTGNARTSTYLDALWRPVYTVTQDLADPANTTQIIKHQFDHGGHTTFTSYPKSSYADLTNGVTQAYDALGRPTETSTDSEQGVLTSKFSYDAGFAKVHTDARGLPTTYRYQAFDEPSENAIVSITAPEGLTVSIDRDVFSKPKAIARNGGGKSATRSYVYDANERLCKTIEPETGATLQDYDSANNVAWRAPGLALTSLTCDRASVPSASKISFGYDALNRPPANHPGPRFRRQELCA